MAYDEQLASRLRTILKGTRGLKEQKLFGGVGFLIRGNMACGVHKDMLMLRIEPESTAKMLKRSHVRQFDLTGRPMKGWILVGADGFKTGAALTKWVKEGVAFASSLPPK